MAVLTIRNVDDAIKQSLRIRAAENGSLSLRAANKTYR